MDLAQLQKSLTDEQGSIPPVEEWSPDFCGDIDMQIKADGSWWYMGTPIGREALVKLFSSVLKKEADDYFLVTPVEKVGIQVADVPFVITEWDKREEFFVFGTKQGDKIVIGEQHPCELRQSKLSEEALPYVCVRKNLWARIHQNVFYQLADLGKPALIDGRSQLMLNSGGYRFSLGYLD